MKYIVTSVFIILLAGITSLPIYSQTSNKSKETIVSTEGKIHWYTFEEASKLNAKHPKKIFVDMYTDWCGWCKRLDAVTFAHPEIVKYVNAHFYAVKFNAERKDAVKYLGKEYVNQDPDKRQNPHDLAAFFLQGKMSYPTVVFLDEKMKEIGPLPGYKGPKEFEMWLNFIGSDSYLKEKADDFNSNFQGKVTE